MNSRIIIRVRVRQTKDYVALCHAALRTLKYARPFHLWITDSLGINLNLCKFVDKTLFVIGIYINDIYI